MADELTPPLTTYSPEGNTADRFRERMQSGQQHAHDQCRGRKVQKAAYDLQTARIDIARAVNDE